MIRIPGKIALIALFFVTLTNAGEPIRIDASSDASAQASFERMLSVATAQNRQELQVALIQLNLAAVQNPALQELSVVRIKDKVAGLTADQIIELANKTSTFKVKITSQ